MKLLLPLILLVTLLAGCASQVSKLTDDQLFEKKKECASYRDKMELDVLNLEQKLERYKLTLGDIFYSEKENSCLYVIEYEGNKLGKGANMRSDSGPYTFYAIFDFLNNTSLFDNQQCMLDESIGCIEAYQKALKDLKGE